MDNGRTKEVITQFNNISKLPDLWDHNRQYHDFLLYQIKSNIKNSLDIGCGTGELTKRLSRYCDKVIGIDVSESMIIEAKKRNSIDTVFYKCQDIESFLKETNTKFDFIISVATFHHLNMKNILQSLKDILNPKGSIVILDLYKNNNILEYLLSIFASLCNPVMYLLKRKRLFITKEEKRVWKDHYKYDKYLTINEIRIIAESTLGNVKIKRHLFWRYSLIYNQNYNND